MKATDILSEEHRIITKVLDCLQAIAAEAEATGRLNGEAAEQALDFFRNFADGCHHAKEEDRLFVVMEQQGVPREGGPIGVMLMEHDHGRAYVQQMAESVPAASEGDAQAVARFAQAARDFDHLLRLHIQKEDNVLFPMAGHVLDGQTAEGLLADFRRIETEAGGKRHQHYLGVARALCERYGVPFVAAEQTATLRTEFGAA